LVVTQEGRALTLTLSQRERVKTPALSRGCTCRFAYRERGSLTVDLRSVNAIEGKEG